MNIPDKAVEAAGRAYSWWECDTETKQSRLEYALEAAAPYIAAQALRDAAEDIRLLAHHTANEDRSKAFMRARAVAVDRANEVEQ